MMFNRVALSATLAALAGFATAQNPPAGFSSGGLSVTSPSSDIWWVAQSQNQISWTCQTSTFQTFTVLVGNTDPKVLTQPEAVIAIENNFDCSKLITQDQASQAVGTGYFVVLANPLNNTDVYATSELFEIKALGSAYPSTTAAAGPSSSGSSTASSSSSSPSAAGSSSQNSSSGALSLQASLGGLTALAAAGLAALLA